MSIEDRITSTLSGTLGALDGTPGDLAAVHRSGERMRARRRVLAGGVAAVVVALVVTGGLVLRGDEPDVVQPAPAGGTWERLPDLPLAPRANPVTAWTGSEVLVIGGYLTVCPPNAGCVDPDELARDGAAFDPSTNTWRDIADAPVELASYFRSAMAGDTFVLFDGRERWLTYDVGDDEWRELPKPSETAADMGSLVASNGFVYTLSRSGQILVLDLELEEWGEYADRVPDGIRPQTVVWTHQGLVVSGEPEPSGPRPENPGVAAILGGDTFPVGQLNPFRHWTGERLVELDLQVTENDDGTTTPYGGALDPATGEWSPLPNQPKDSPGDGWSLVAANGPLLAGWGYVYDDRDRTWTRLGRPEDAVARHGTSAVWADGRLIVVGGADDRSEPTDHAWVWRRE